MSYYSTGCGYTSNNLNQYSSISTLRASVSPCELSYDSDGNLIQDDSFAYAYDAENRLISVDPRFPVEGSFAVENRYSHKNLRVRKIVRCYTDGGWTDYATHDFTYDGGNIVLERITLADGTIRTCEYFWGNDLSGTEQGAGGVGGLIAVSVDGLFFIPCYDHNGNSVCYVSESGTIAAQYVYDPYGNVIVAVGPNVDLFSLGFSTKYHDREVGLVGYQYRYLDPVHGRWLNRDPIEEKGGENLYAFCGNDPDGKIDLMGCGTWKFAVDYGVPQCRERVFIVGLRNDLALKWSWPERIDIA